MMKVIVRRISSCKLEGMVKLDVLMQKGPEIIYYPKNKADEKDLKKDDALYLDKDSMCSCCNYYYGYKSEYDICPNCGWENDWVQRKDPNFRGGANKMSLNEAKNAYTNGKEIK